jgi:hypothetical protein
MLSALSMLGFASDASAISLKWSELIGESVVHQEPEYLRCFPKTIVASLASHARKGVQGMQCVSVTPSNIGNGIRSQLNQAWQQFWASPQTFVAWERAAVSVLLAEPTESPVLTATG